MARDCLYILKVVSNRLVYTRQKKFALRFSEGKGRKNDRGEKSAAALPRFPNVGLLLLLFVLFQTQLKLSKIWSKCSRVLKEFYVEGTISSKDDANME